MSDGVIDEAEPVGMELRFFQVVERVSTDHAGLMFAERRCTPPGKDCCVLLVFHLKTRRV